MKYTAAYLLAILAGNASPDVAAIAKILTSVGIECDEKHAQQVVDACKDRDVNEIIENGMAKVDEALANTSGGTTQTHSINITTSQIIPSPSLGSPTEESSPPDSPTGSDGFIGLFD